jgi:assimilatory nitrate reductase catalytic subunit
VQWPLRAAPYPSPARGGSDDSRFFADGHFFTADGKARFVAPEPPSLHTRLTPLYPLRLNTGRLRDQWHTMTRTGLSPRLGHHAPEPMVEVHPADASVYGLTHGGFARLRSAYGVCVLKVAVTDTQRRGTLFAPIHWSRETSSSARIGELVAPAVDPVSGQPEAKATPVAVEPVAYAYRGFALFHAPFAFAPDTWWARIRVPSGAGFLLASDDAPALWRARVRAMVGRGQVAEYFDAARGLYRMAAFEDGRLTGCLFVGPAASAPQWETVRAMFDADALDAGRAQAMPGAPNRALVNPGPTICACFSVGLNVIRAALASGAAANVEEIGAALKAGTRCGSCLPELKRIVAHERLPQTA